MSGSHFKYVRNSFCEKDKNKCNELIFLIPGQFTERLETVIIRKYWQSEFFA